MLLRKYTDCGLENIVWFLVEPGIFIFSNLYAASVWSTQSSIQWVSIQNVPE